MWASIVFGALTILLLILGFFEQKQGKHSKRSVSIAIILSAVSGFVAIFLMICPVGASSFDLSYKTRFKILTFILASIGFAAILFETNFDKIFKKFFGIHHISSKVFSVCTLALAVISLAVTFHFSTDGQTTDDVQGDDEVSSQIEETTPEPTAEIREVKIFFLGEESNEFTMHMGEDPVKLTAVALPQEKFADAIFEWECSDEDCMRITISDDTKACTCEILKPKQDAITLSAVCDGVRRSIKVFLFE